MQHSGTRDESDNSTISFDYDENEEEVFSVNIENGIPVFFGNKSTFKLLAKTFAKLALSDYQDGFHIHINKDFDAD